MKKIKHTSIALILVMGAFVPALGSSTQRVGPYDFAYLVSGDARATPIQVFDNGTKTYFQFRAGEPVPAILTQVGDTTDMVIPRYEGQYVVIDNTYGHFILSIGRSQAHVVYTDGGRPGSPMIKQTNSSGLETPYQGGPIATGTKLVATQPAIQSSKIPDTDIDRNSYATPVKGDMVEWSNPVEVSQDHSIAFITGSARLGPLGIKTVRALALSMANAHRIEITGRDDDSHKEGVADARAAAVVDLFAASGIPRDRMFMKTSAQVKTSSIRGAVVGVSIVAYSSKPYLATKTSAEARLAAGPTQYVDKALEDLRAGRITPSQAKAAITESQGTQAVAPIASKWLVKASDVTVNNMLTRWGSESGWKVINNGAPSVTIYGDAVVERPDFLKAAEYVVSQAKQAGYSVKATAYSNNVLVLTEEGAK